MEEGFEVEAKIEPEEEAPKSWLIPAIAVTTAVLAVVAALSSLLAGRAAHHSLSDLNEAAILQNQATDQWNFYQAEGIKRHVFEVQRDAYRMQGTAEAKALAASYDAGAKKYAAQQADIRKEAEGHEHERDALKAMSQAYDVQYQRLALAVAVLQIGIVVCSVAAIIRQPALWYLAIVAGVVGIIILLVGLVPPKTPSPTG